MSSPSIRFRSLRGGVLYFVLVFAIGFALGTIRFLIVVPRIGELAGVLIELPIILTLAWLLSGWVIAKLQIPRLLAPRLTMSVCALTLLFAAEITLSIWGFGNSLEGHLGSYGTLHGALGLGGQVAFATFPILRLWTRPGQ